MTLPIFQPPPPSPFDPALEVRYFHDPGVEPMAEVHLSLITQEAYRAGDSSDSAPRQTVLLAQICEHQVRTFPLDLRRDSETFLSPKHGEIVAVNFMHEKFGWDVPQDPGGFISILEGLPAGFIKQYGAGLGIAWEFRHLIDAIVEIKGINELVLTEGKETGIDGTCYRLGISRFDQLRRALNRVSSHAQRDALQDKRLICYTNLQTAVDSIRFPRRFKEIKPGAIYEVINIGERGNSASNEDRKAALDFVRSQHKAIARDDKGAEALMSLKAEIEVTALEAVVQTFEKLLAQNANEPAWQNFIKSNPFVLNLTLPYPLFVVQDLAYVGGTRLQGGGEKIADFLLAQQYTGNLAIVEIKKPASQLLAPREYRADLYAPSQELSGAITQVLDQRYRLHVNFTAKAYESGLKDVHPYAIQCFVIAGRSPESAPQRKSLELFRQSSKDVAILTFDELLEKLKGLQRVLTAKPPGPTDVDLPF